MPNIILSLMYSMTICLKSVYVVLFQCAHSGFWLHKTFKFLSASFFHKVDITEGASAQFSIWIFNFLAIGANQGNSNTEKNGPIMSNVWRRFFSCFHQRYRSSIKLGDITKRLIYIQLAYLILIPWRACKTKTNPKTSTS